MRKIIAINKCVPLSSLDFRHELHLDPLILDFNGILTAGVPTVTVKFIFWLNKIKHIYYDIKEKIILCLTHGCLIKSRINSNK